MASGDGRERNGGRWLMNLWRSVVAGLLVAGIVASVAQGRQLAAVASILDEVQRRLDRHEDRLLYIERRADPWRP